MEDGPIGRMGDASVMPFPADGSTLSPMTGDELRAHNEIVNKEVHPMEPISTGTALFALLMMVFAVTGVLGTMFWVWMLIEAATKEPDGGITGMGDGRAPDFARERRGRQVVWQDRRTIDPSLTGLGNRRNG